MAKRPFFSRWAACVAAASLLVAFSILVVVGSGAAPRLLAALGWSRALCCGLACIATGNLVLVAWPQVAGIGLAAGICGLGIGIGSVAATDMGTAVDEPVRSTAAGVLNTAAQLGTAIGTALVVLVATAFEPRIAWAVVAVLAASGALAAAWRAPAGPRARR
jgi:predicted MFS family arabinose efflux permease